MKGGTLFSGIGAPELAAPSIDWRWCAEIDSFAAAVHKARFPKIPNLGDVTRIKPDAVEPVDLIVYGSPCQSFSVAGRRGGLDDARGELALVAIQLARELGTRWLVFENVPGLLSQNGGRDFGTVLGFLGECGYGWAYRIFDAQYFGVPQRRRRLFLVACAGGDWRGPAAVLFERSSLSGDPGPRREAGQVVARPIASDAHGGSGYRNDADTADNLITAFAVRPNAKSAAWRADGADNFVLADPVSANEGRTYTHEGKNNFRLHNVVQAFDVTGTPATTGGRETEIHTPLRARAPGRSQHDTTTLLAYGGNRYSGPQDVASAINGHGGPNRRQQFETETFIFDTTQVTSPDNYSRPKAGDPCHPLAATAHVPTVAFESRFARNGRGAPEEVVPPLKAQSGETGKGDSAPLLASPMSVRRLTPRECERLQGLPDDHTLIRFRGKPAADGPRYRTVGNSMAGPVVGWVLRRVEEVAGDPKLQIRSL